MSAAVSSSTDTVDSSKTPSGNTRPNRTAGAGRSGTQANNSSSSNPRSNSDGLVVVASSLSANSQAAKNEAFSNVSRIFHFLFSSVSLFSFGCLELSERFLSFFSWRAEANNFLDFRNCSRAEAQRRPSLSFCEGGGRVDTSTHTWARIPPPLTYHPSERLLAYSCLRRYRNRKGGRGWGKRSNRNVVLLVFFLPSPLLILDLI